MKYIIPFLLALSFCQTSANASAKSAFEIYQKDKSSKRNKKIAHELIEGQFFFSAIPFINTYLEENNSVDSELEEDIEMLVMKTGAMAVLNLDETRLSSFTIPSISLILGTRLFNKEKYENAYSVLSKIPDNHKFAIEASLIKGTIRNLNRLNIEASNLYDFCAQNAHLQESLVNNEKLKRYYNYLKETCLIRGARIKIEDKKYEEALEIYQKIDKRSYRWPYVLLDKAWANYYLSDYNRALGLTVTYKSPLLESYFFPESEVLMALSYYNLCLWDDALKVVNHFYEHYKPKADALKTIIGQNKKSDTYFLDLYYADIKTREDLNPFTRNLITQTRKQVKFNLDISSLKAAKDELAQLKNLKNKNDFTLELESNMNTTITFISTKINYYIKKEIFSFINEIHKHSHSMFNLKLELLSKKRDDLYSVNKEKEENRSRGSVLNVNRKPSQYYFDFNGSFWADELGDFSFGLKSQCVKNE